MESGVHPPRTHELLQELRDISSMAMEHFDEHLLPRINKMQASIDNSELYFFIIINHSTLIYFRRFICSCKKYFKITCRSKC